jgi:two-component system sensor histidine kinase CpxA
LHGAIENVVRNAIRYTSAGTSVDVSLGPEGMSRILLAIRDRGTGVPESDLAKIFQPFYRVAEARDRDSGGVGLGLAIADRVMRIHGGTIRAENVQPAGLRVVIEIPVANSTSVH